MSLPFAERIKLFSISILFQSSAMTRQKIDRQGFEGKEADLSNFEVVFAAERKVGGKEKDIVVAFPFFQVGVRADQP